MKHPFEEAGAKGHSGSTFRLSRSISSDWLKRSVKIDIIDYKRVAGTSPGLLLLNDGQELENLGISHPLKQIQGSAKKGSSPIIVAIHAGNRKAEYGISGFPDYMGRGALAHQYEQFVISELMPEIKKITGIEVDCESTYFAGCSLGGLSAFDIALSNRNIFKGAGIFSGSLWWRSKPYGLNYFESDRIIFNKLESYKSINDFRCWLMAGTDDEKSDRNNNGVIDAIDDTLDLFDLLCERTHKATNQICLNIVNGGQHNFTTWKKEFPKFFDFAFGSNIN